MIAEVIPARRMPVCLPFFNYSIPENLRDNILVGQLVKIPLRSKIEFGVVKRIINENNIKLKEIDEIVCKSPILSASQLDFLQDVSGFYKTSLGFLLKQNLLPLQKRKIQKFFLKDFVGNESGKEILNTKADSQMSKPKLHIFQNLEERSKMLERLLARQGQILFLVPEVSDIERIIAEMPQIFRSESIVITSDLSEKEMFERWLEIWQGKKRIIIGTRVAFFMPWYNLKTIIVDDEANINHKSWDMAPRLHARDAALFLSRHHNATLHLISHTPSVESYFFAQKDIFALQGELQPTSNMPIVVNMNDERQWQNFGILSKEVKNRINDAKNEDVFLFINRLGTCGYLACRDCGEAMLCDKCGRALTFLKDTNQFRCNNCHTVQQPLVTCPKCKGQNIRTFAVGTQAVEVEINKLFSDRTILRVDSDADNLEKLKTPEAKIIIGTQFAWSHINWKRIKLLIFVDIDSSLFIPEYKAAEELWQKLRSALFNMKNGEVVLQTRKPEHTVFSYIHQPESFYENELKERRALRYPP
ncbi:primosomal protein N', partial [Patescibacteria group bacterium]|nr:primosomal protein N' [Patescibacteria group bacterium]